MIADTVEKESDVSIMRGLNQALRDKYVWLFALEHHLHSASSGFRIFLPTLFNTLGYSTTITLVLTCPPYLFSAAVAIILGLSSGKFNERTWHLTGLKFTAMLGFILGCASMNTGARLVAAFLFVGCTFGVTSLTLGWVGITCGQTKEKRAASLAIVNTAASISLIWSSVCNLLFFPCLHIPGVFYSLPRLQYLWPDSAGPRYTLPLAASAAMCAVSIACIWIIRLLLMRENTRIRRADESARLLYAY